jgi:formylglycine-generating enzyme required for sulfatase activity
MAAATMEAITRATAIQATQVVMQTLEAELAYRENITRDFQGVEMVIVPPGCFLMGSTDGESDESPVNEQCFDEPFWIDRYEVNGEQFRRLGGLVQEYTPSQNPILPVVNISWYEATSFCEKRDARVPTEAEWEYAARGPVNYVYPWGNEFKEDYVAGSHNSVNGPSSVGLHPAGISWVGAQDMAGNVAEWVSSVYARYPYTELTSILGARVVRGGSWSDDPSTLRSSNRSFNFTATRNMQIGFRCVRD